MTTPAATPAAIRRAMAVVARHMQRPGGTAFAPIFERLDDELAKAETSTATLNRARQFLEGMNE